MVWTFRLVAIFAIRSCGYEFYSGLIPTGSDLYPGSVSVGVWQMACKRVILIGERVVKDLLGEYTFY